MGRRCAFTLLEVTLVMAIIIITMALASPLVFDALYGDTRVTAASDMVRASWAECRAHAIEEGRSYAFSIVPNSGRFKIGPYDGTDQSMLDPTIGAQDINSLGHIIEDELPNGVRFGSSDSPADAGTGSDNPGTGEYVTVAVFLPDGSAHEDVEITFGAAEASFITLKLRALTGTANSTRSSQEAKK